MDLTDYGLFLSGGTTTQSRLLSQLHFVAFKDSLFIAYLSLSFDDQIESYWTIKFIQDFYTVQKKILLNGKNTIEIEQNLATLFILEVFKA
jgi:hypothetical protein